MPGSGDHFGCTTWQRAIFREGSIQTSFSQIMHQQGKHKILNFLWLNGSGMAHESTLIIAPFLAKRAKNVTDNSDAGACLPVPGASLGKPGPSPTARKPARRVVLADPRSEKN
jgi:hypothetical protein